MTLLLTVIVTRIGIYNPLRPEILKRTTQVGLLQDPPRQRVKGQWTQASESVSCPWVVLLFSGTN